MKKWFSFAGVIAMAALNLAASGCAQPSSAQLTHDGKTPAAAKQLDRVTAATLQPKNLKLYTSQPGRVEAFEVAPLFPKVTGYVEEVLVDIGDAVTKDQPLVKLWIPEMQDELEQMQALVAQAEAEVRQAEAAVDAAKAAAETAQAKIHQVEAGIARADGEFDRWKAEFSRIEELAANGSVTKKLADETLNQLRAAEAAQKETVASVASAKAAATEARANIQKAEADQGTDEARLRVAKANLARTTTMAGYATIKAPFDGVVTHRNVDTGHYVQPANGGGIEPLVVVARTDLVRIFVDVPELEASLVDSGDGGDAAMVQVQALGSREFDANVTRTSWALNSSNRSLRAEIDFPNPDGLLRPGMYANATILLEERSDALALPITAIIRDGSDTFCCCVESGKIERQSIQLGLRFGDEVEVLSGLDVGRVVVLARAESLSQGQAVEVLAPEEK
jgi:RND family efflux transporter MFP subunit